MKRLLVQFSLWLLGLYCLSFLADLFLLYAPTFPYADAILPNYNLPRWIYSWANFDGVHYLTIVSHGYIGTGLIQAFFPVYPGLIWLDGLFHINAIISGQIISLVSFFGVLLIWSKLFEKEFTKSISHISLGLLLFFPTSFFFAAVYTESLFLLLILSSFYFAKKKQWMYAIILAAVASGTKVIGIALLPALVIEYLYQRNLLQSQFISHPKKLLHEINFTDFTKLITIFLSAGGLLLYMIFLWIEFRDPLYFFHVQEEFGGGRSESLILLPQVLVRYIKIFVTVDWQNWKFFAYTQEFALSILALTTLIVGWIKKLRPSYLVFSSLAFLLPTLTGTFSSMPRYILVCFPMFLVIAKWLEDKPKLRFAWYGISSILLILNTVLFIQGYWIA